MSNSKIRKTASSGKNVKQLDKELGIYYDFLMDGKPPVIWYIDEDPKSYWNEFAMEPKRFNIVCAAPGVGKTAFVHQLVFKAMQVDKNLKVLELNCDIPLDTVLGRELSRRSQLSPDMIRFKGFIANQKGYTDEQKKHITVAKKSFNETIGERYFFLGSNSSFQEAEKAIEQHKPNIFIVDYIQIVKMQSDNDTSRLTPTERIATFCQQCKVLKDEHDLCIVAIAAATKESIKKDDITLSSIRDSTELIYAPDDAIVINRTGEGDGILEFRFEKRRNGDASKKVYFKFDGKTQTFTPIVSEEEEEDDNTER